jgi:hypothetical protein
MSYRLIISAIYTITTTIKGLEGYKYLLKEAIKVVHRFGLFSSDLESTEEACVKDISIPVHKAKRPVFADLFPEISSAKIAEH